MSSAPNGTAPRRRKNAIPPGARFTSSFSPAQRPDVEDKETCPEGVPPPGTLRALRRNLTASWWEVSIYEGALIELAGTFSLTFLSSLIGLTLTSPALSLPPTTLLFLIPLSNLVLLSLHILATAPASGGHLNPLITTSAFFVGMCEAPRWAVYVLGQAGGAALAGGVVRGIVGFERARVGHGGGCWMEKGGEVKVGQAFLLEMMSSFCLVFLSFGLGLDPRAAEAFGSVLGPIFIGASLALLTFSSALLLPNFTGANMNPTRCLGLAVARGNYEDQWIWWIAPLAGAFLISLLYYAVPPYPRSTRKRQ